MQTNAKRVESTRASRALAEKRLEAEEKKFQAGMTSSFLVIQAQRDLSQARNSELQAIIDYLKSVVDFETAQQSPLAAAVAASRRLDSRAAAAAGGPSHAWEGLGSVASSGRPQRSQRQKPRGTSSESASASRANRSHREPTAQPHLPRAKRHRTCEPTARPYCEPNASGLPGEPTGRTDFAPDVHRELELDSRRCRN